MKLLTYRTNNLEAHQIGVLQNQLIYNLNNCFGDISLVELIQIEDYKEKAASYISNKDCLKYEQSSFLKEKSMFQKFKITSYALIILLVLVLPSQARGQTLSTAPTIQMDKQIEMHPIPLEDGNNV